MNDNTETNKAYQDRMTKLALRVSNALDDVNLEESAVICARISGFALGQIPLPHRNTIAAITMNVWQRAIVDGENAALAKEEDEVFKTAGPGVGYD
jgi:hypothetical protein